MSNARNLAKEANSPAFSASGNAQSIPNNTATLVATSTEIYDTNNNFDNSAENYKFQPTVSGYYDVTGSTISTGGIGFSGVLAKAA